MRGLALLLALGALAAGCRGPVPASPLPAGDPRPDALLAAWQAHTADRESLRAVARLAVDAPGARAGGEDLAFRSKQRLWLSRPAKLRVEVLGFLDTALAVLVTDGERYALLESDRFEEGPIYDGLLWDAARLDLSPEEAVEVILGAPDRGGDWRRSGAWQVGDRVRIELAEGAARRTLEFGPEGELLVLSATGGDGRAAWHARFDDYVPLDGVPFARRISVESDAGRADLVLRDVELNPTIPEDWFRLEAPEGG